MRTGGNGGWTFVQALDVNDYAESCSLDRDGYQDLGKGTRLSAVLGS